MFWLGSCGFRRFVRVRSLRDFLIGGNRVFGVDLEFGIRISEWKFYEYRGWFNIRILIIRIVFYGMGYFKMSS